MKKKFMLLPAVLFVPGIIIFNSLLLGQGTGALEPEPAETLIGYEEINALEGHYQFDKKLTSYAPCASEFDLEHSYDFDTQFTFLLFTTPLAKDDGKMPNDIVMNINKIDSYEIYADEDFKILEQIEFERIDSALVFYRTISRLRFNPGKKILGGIITIEKPEWTLVGQDSQKIVFDSGYVTIATVWHSGLDGEMVTLGSGACQFKKL